jgi:hypothetical protein
MCVLGALQFSISNSCHRCFKNKIKLCLSLEPPWKPTKIRFQQRSVSLHYYFFLPYDSEQRPSSGQDHPAEIFINKHKRRRCIRRIRYFLFRIPERTVDDVGESGRVAEDKLDEDDSSPKK